MKKLILFSSFLLTIFLIGFLSAEVQYPVAELGNCESEEACQLYCDDTSNIEVCLTAAEKYSLMSAEEIAEARRFMPFILSGETPGRCKGKKECDAYCDDDANINECVDFALKVGLISAEEAEIVKKTGGKGPGGCKRDECDAFCEDEANIEICIDFAVQYGLMDPSEVEMAKKTKGKGPGGCRGQEECDAFCKDKNNFQVCVDFAVQYGMMTAEEAEMAKKTGGESPGGCSSQEECEAFCNSEEGRQVCMEFSREHGLMSEEEYKQGMMNGGKGQTGPGGCANQEECEAYCSSEEGKLVCMEYSVQTGEMSQEEYNRAVQGEQGEQGEMMTPGEQVPRLENNEPGDMYVPPVEAPSGDMGSGGATPGDEYVAPVVVESAPPSSDSESSSSDSGATGAVIMTIEREDAFTRLRNGFRELFE